jgi:toxin ParE1/3/4
MSYFRLTEQAKADIRQIWDYIGIIKENPEMASHQVELIYERLHLLATQPLLGQLRDDLKPGLRIFAADNYAILYYPYPNGIEVVGVIHGARDIEGMFRHGER